MTAQYILLKIVYEVANVNGWQWVLVKGDIIPMLASTEETVMLSTSRARYQNTISLTVDIFHSLCLVIEIPVRPLNNADRVNP